jgi:hypothetical protein
MIMRIAGKIFRDFIRQIRAVNEKYKHPDIEMTPLARTSLIGLRVYLFVLVGLMLFKFIYLASH